MKIEFNRMTASILLTSSLVILSAALLPQREQLSHNREIAMVDTANMKSHSSSSTYYIPLTQSDKKNIRYIISTLATKSSISLLFYKKSLTKAGNNVDHVHPLTFLSYIFTDKTLKRYVNQIRGIPWNEFVKGMAKSLQSAKRRNDLPSAVISDFTTKVGVDRGALENTIKKGQWEKFINQVRNHLQFLAEQPQDGVSAAHPKVASKD